MRVPQLTADEHSDWFDAVREGHEGIITEMAEKFPGIVDITHEGVSGLLSATEAHNEKIVTLLLKLGAKVDAEDEAGSTPLISTACTGAAGIMKLLLEHGAQIETRFGEALSTPLHCAAHNGNTDCVKLLIENGADIMAKTGDGLTALQEAKKTKSTETAKYLEFEMSRHAFAEEARMLTEGLPKPLKVGHKINLQRKKDFTQDNGP